MSEVKFPGNPLIDVVDIRNVTPSYKKSITTKSYSTSKILYIADKVCFNSTIEKGDGIHGILLI